MMVFAGTRAEWRTTIGTLLAMGIAGAMLMNAAASAEVSSDKAGAILIFPKVVADRIGGKIRGTGLVEHSFKDTLIQISNASPHQIAARCFLVNANSHCSNAGVAGVPLVCDTDAQCNPEVNIGGHCIAGWQETDFRFHLTAYQPIWWKLSEGMSVFPLNGGTKVGAVDNDPSLPAELLGQPASNNALFDSSIPPAPETPFLGELKCVQVDLATEQPTRGTNPTNNFAGDLVGIATIVEVEPEDPSADARSYNAIGIQATDLAAGGDNTLILGGDEPEYDGCPSILILDHFFDGAVESAAMTTVTTTLTLIPCSENFLTQDGGRVSTVAQYLVFNEFEQRFSSSSTVRCFETIQLSDLGSRPGTSDDAGSIFNVGVQGTLTGQTRIRAVDADDPTRGDGLLAVAEEYHQRDNGHAAAMNVHQTGVRAHPDVIVMP